MSSPTAPSQRITSLDLIRGIAVCGLVPINSIEFGIGATQLIYPLDISQADRGLWALVMGLGCGKFATLFAALFGAGLLLFCERAEASGRSAKSVYLPRLAWLFVFGMLHAYLLWHGDILVTYALVGFVLFWCRNWPAKAWGIVAGALMTAFVAPLLIAAVFCHFIDFSALAEQLSGTLDAVRAEGERETAALTGNLGGQMLTRALYAFVTQLLGIPLYLFWFAAMMMCFGIALMKSGFFSGGWSPEKIRKTTILLLSSGLPLTLGGYTVFAFAEPAPAPLLWAYVALFSGLPLVAFGYAGLGVIWAGRGEAGFVRRGIEAVGRMALTNYISQSAILGLIYYGHGLGLRGNLDFHQVMLIAPAIWGAQMIVSTWWLRRFRHGPLEWLWRRLTYGRAAMGKRITPPSLP